jgi:mannose-6-phosphate isomerase
VWVLSGVEGEPSIVENGFLKDNELNELVEVYLGDLVGETVFDRFGNEFPILIKFIDANDWLSIQVHPDDKLAMKRHNSMGKSEMWYILDAEEDSQLISGFSQKTNKEGYQRHLNNKTLKSIMNFEKVSKGDVFFIPAGRVHALGPGILLAEIQQTSDITYRIYDWNRIDKAGMMRELHTDLALDAIDFNIAENYKTNFKTVRNTTVNLVKSAYFNTSLMDLDRNLTKDYSELDSFVVYVCAEGSFDLIHENDKYPVSLGEVVLLPAITEEIEIHPHLSAKILEVFILPG